MNRRMDSFLRNTSLRLANVDTRIAAYQKLWIIMILAIVALSGIVSILIVPPFWQEVSRVWVNDKGAIVIVIAFISLATLRYKYRLFEFHAQALKVFAILVGTISITAFLLVVMEIDPERSPFGEVVLTILVAWVLLDIFRPRTEKP